MEDLELIEETLQMFDEYLQALEELNEKLKESQEIADKALAVHKEIKEGRLHI